MHKFAFCWGSAADPIGGALPPDGDLLTVFTEPTIKGTGERGGKEKRREKGKVKGKERRRGERRDLAHPEMSAWRPLWQTFCNVSAQTFVKRWTQENILCMLKKFFSPKRFATFAIDRVTPPTHAQR